MSLDAGQDLNPPSETQRANVYKIHDRLTSLKEVSSAHQGCVYLIKNTVKTVML